VEEVAAMSEQKHQESRLPQPVLDMLARLERCDELEARKGVNWATSTVLVFVVCAFVIGFATCQIVHAIFPGFNP
jgi:ABC-type Co2+ transport system permease subunit